MAESSYFIIFITAILSGNMVFAKFLGLCPFFGVTNKMEDAVGMGFAVIVVQMVTVLVTWPLYHLVLLPLGLEILKTMMFILVIAACVQMLEAIMKKIAPRLYKALGVFLPLITTNCIILGIALIIIAEKLDFGRAMWYAFCASLGFMLALVLMTAKSCTRCSFSIFYCDNYIYCIYRFWWICNELNSLYNTFIKKEIICLYQHKFFITY